MSEDRKRPNSPLGDRRPEGSAPEISPNGSPDAAPEGVLQAEHARRRVPSTRRPGAPRRRGGKPPGGKPPRGRGVGRVFIWLIILVLVGAGGYLGWQGWQSGPAEEDFSTDLQPLPVAGTAAGDRAVVLVFPEWDASGYVTEERQIPSRDREGEDLLGLMRVLCEGPRISGAVSAFPEGTAALNAFFNPQDSSVVLDFSQELVTGHPGGSTAEAATLTSILRTVALNFPDTRSCTILVDGAQVQTLAGHLTMDRPFDPRRWL